MSHRRRCRLLTLLLLLSAVWLPTAAAAADPVGEWPLSPTPEVVDTFDPPDNPWGAGHRGVDLAGRPGQPVLAALPGRIAFAGSVAGRPVVTVSHGATRTTYQPVTTALARGTRVDAGTVIGRLGILGSHCFPTACLHWGWIRGKTYLDPLRLVGGGPVRLLPLAGLPASAGSAGSSAATVAGSLPLVSPYAGWTPPVDGVRLWP